MTDEHDGLDDEPELPIPLEAAHVARACRMTTDRAKRLLQRAGIAELLGGRWTVGESRLRERLPDVFDRVYSFYVLRRLKTR
jgi:hypothetical protein